MLSRPVIGVMGGICSGKSLVSSIFGEFGFVVIDADKIVSELYNDRQFVERQLVPVFGEKVADENKQVNREFLSDVVFDDKEKLGRLNSIVHPVVLDRIKELLSVYRDSDHVRGVILDVPLLLETGLDKDCDVLLFVETDEALRRQRAMKRSGISQKELEKRQKSQIFLDKKKNIANYTVYNNTETSVLRVQVADVISDINHKFSGE
ncbi:MAG: dephospho-CoA kinase [Sedimentisphaeraceae bacterium JB056]